MPLNRCYGGFRGCPVWFDADPIDIYCPSCKEQRSRGSASQQRPTKTVTLTVKQAWAALADAAGGTNDDYETRICDTLIKAAIAKPGSVSTRTAETQRRDLTPY